MYNIIVISFPHTLRKHTHTTHTHTYTPTHTHTHTNKHTHTHVTCAWELVLPLTQFFMDKTPSSRHLYLVEGPDQILLKILTSTNMFFEAVLFFAP